MAARLLRGLWQSATDWLLALTVIFGLLLARGLVFAPLAIPLAASAQPGAPGDPDTPAPAPAPAPVPVPVPAPVNSLDGSRIVEVAGLAFAFAGLLARLWLKDRELKRGHADDLVNALREIADLKREAAESSSMIFALRAACPNKESCPVRILDGILTSRNTTGEKPRKIEDLSDVDGGILG